MTKTLSKIHAYRRNDDLLFIFTFTEINRIYAVISHKYQILFKLCTNLIFFAFFSTSYSTSIPFIVILFLNNRI